MKCLLLAAAFAVFPATAVAAAPESATESLAFSLAPLADETRLVSSLLRMANELREKQGVTAVNVRLSKREVLVEFEPESTGVPSLVAAVESLGFRASSRPAAPMPAPAEGETATP